MLLLLVAAAACAPTREAGPLEGPAAPAAPTSSAVAPVKAAPRWVRLADLAGSGDQRTRSFEVGTDLLQWRVTVTCQSGSVAVGLAGRPEPLVEGPCPGPVFGFSIDTGTLALDVRAAGPWAAVIDRQVDHPLDEPPLAGMTVRNRRAAGAFSGVEQEGMGAAVVFELPDGRRALRLDPFFVTPDDDLFVWVTEAEAPRTSADALFAPHVQLAPLKATAGPQNYLLPPELPLERVRSIVIWCEPVRTAYAAAPLRRE